MKTEMVQSKLEFLGYACNPFDLDYIEENVIPKIENQIKMFTNQNELPEEIQYIELDMCVAEFLKVKKIFGQLPEALFEQVVASVSMGDTSFSFQQGKTNEERFDALMDEYLHGYKEELLRYRKMVW